MTLFVEPSHQRHKCGTHHTMSRFDPDQRALTSHPAPSWVLGLITRRSHSCRKKQPNTIGRPQNIIPTPPTIMAKRPSITMADTTRKPHIMPTRLEAMRFTRESTPRKPARPTWRSTARNSVPFLHLRF